MCFSYVMHQWAVVIQNLIQISHRNTWKHHTQTCVLQIAISQHSLLQMDFCDKVSILKDQWSMHNEISWSEVCWATAIKGKRYVNFLIWTSGTTLQGSLTVKPNLLITGFFAGNWRFSHFLSIIWISFNNSITRQKSRFFRHTLFRIQSLLLKL